MRTPGGRRRIPESEILRIQGEERRKGRVMGYARVSSPSQKDDLERQVAPDQKQGSGRSANRRGFGTKMRGGEILRKY